MRSRVLVTCPQLRSTIDRYEKVFAEHQIDVELPNLVQALSEDELVEIIGEFDGVIAGDDAFSAAVLERAEKLKVLVKWGVGVDVIDLEAARRLGIHVFNTPGVFAQEVADVVPAI